MNDELMIAVILLLWIAMVAILGRAAYKALKKKKKVESFLLIAIIVVIVGFTGEYAVFLAWGIGCSIGLPIACME